MLCSTRATSAVNHCRIASRLLFASIPVMMKTQSWRLALCVVFRAWTLGRRGQNLAEARRPFSAPYSTFFSRICGGGQDEIHQPRGGSSLISRRRNSQGKLSGAPLHIQSLEHSGTINSCGQTTCRYFQNSVNCRTKMHALCAF